MKNYNTEPEFTGFVSEKLAKNVLKSIKTLRIEQKISTHDYKTANMFLLYFRQKLIISLADSMIGQEELQKELFKAGRK
ncbi:MAG: hypothetical protein WEA56_09990 [Balneolaceae bacterium]